MSLVGIEDDSLVGAADMSLVGTDNMSLVVMSDTSLAGRQTSLVGKDISYWNRRHLSCWIRRRVLLTWAG